MFNSLFAFVTVLFENHKNDVRKDTVVFGGKFLYDNSKMAPFVFLSHRDSS